MHYEAHSAQKLMLIQLKLKIKSENCVFLMKFIYKRFVQLSKNPHKIHNESLLIFI